MTYDTIDFSEIRDYKQFEDLAVAYFRLKKNIINVFVEPSNEGIDRVRNILVTIKVHDGIVEFEHKWVVQCKFQHVSVSQAHGTFDANLNSILATKGLWFDKKNPKPIVHLAQEKIEKAHKGFLNLSLAMNE
jgi:hypothetical protein